MSYLNFAEYISMNGEVDSLTFHKNIDRVTAIIDTATMNRVQNMAEVPDKVKQLSVKLIDLLSVSSGNVTSRSQSAGGVSESESYKDSASIDDETYQMIEEFLLWETDDNGIPLLSRSAL